jgi:hypothetical protein
LAAQPENEDVQNVHPNWEENNQHRAAELQSYRENSKEGFLPGSALRSVLDALNSFSHSHRRLFPAFARLSRKRVLMSWRVGVQSLPFSRGKPDSRLK